MACFLTFATALGRLRLAWTAEGIRALRFVEGLDRDEVGRAPAWVMEAMRRIMAHLAGHPQDLGSIPLDLSSLTPFQRRVAEVLRATVPGQTLSYGDVALLAGRPGAARAVGQAVKANPVLILVPCHRVVAANGPGGWSAFGSPERKARLLALDGKGARWTPEQPPEPFMIRGLSKALDKRRWTEVLRKAETRSLCLPLRPPPLDSPPLSSAFPARRDEASLAWEEDPTRGPGHARATFWALGLLRPKLSRRM